MSLPDIIILALGLSMDAFAVAICTGLTMKKVTVAKALTVGLYFGVFQAAMPFIGYLTASLLADKITKYDHWIAFVMLCFLGGRMIWSGIKSRKEPLEQSLEEASLKPAKMLPLAVATSIDALAVGVSFAFMHVHITPAVSIIGVTTLVLSMAGVKIGNIFGKRFRAGAEIIGGIILALIGIKILLDHIEIIKL